MKISASDVRQDLVLAHENADLSLKVHTKTSTFLRSLRVVHSIRMPSKSPIAIWKWDLSSMPPKYSEPFLLTTIKKATKFEKMPNLRVVFKNFELVLKPWVASINTNNSGAAY